MEKDNFKFPTKYYYVLLDGGTRRATFYSNSTINDAAQWYNWKPNRLHIYNKYDTPPESRWSEYFVGPFADILHAKFYARSRRIETLNEIIASRPVSTENLSNSQSVLVCEIESAEGELKKLQKWMDKLIMIRPEYFL